jgi:hypothetical protein
LTKKKFKHDFLRGLGSALLELKTCENPQQYYDIVHYGCLNNTTYDMQCEGDRGWYLYQAAQIFGGDDILKDVIARYARSFTDDWFFDQLTSILYNFAKDGSEAARATLHDKYNVMLEHLTHINVKTRQYRTSPDRDMFDWLCVWLTSLDGWSAFKRIVNNVSEKLLPKDVDFFFSEWFYDNSKGKLGKKRVEGYLQKQAEKSKYIKVYWLKAQEWEKHIYEKQPEPTLDEVLAGIDDKRFHGRGLSMRFCRNASPENLEKLLEIAMEEQDLTRKAELLWGFRRATAPISEETISELLQSENEDIRDTAFYIIENNPSPKTREYAVSLLKKGEETVNAISLLSKNMFSQDEQILNDTVKSIPVKFADGDWHNAFMSAEDAIKNMRGKPKTDLIHYIYHETYCGSCRERVVRLMHKKGIFTDSLLKEWYHDSNSDIREFAERIIRSKAGAKMVAD